MIILERRFQLNEIEPIFYSKYGIRETNRRSWPKEAEKEYLGNIVPLIKEANELQIKLLTLLEDSKALYMDKSTCLVSQDNTLIIKELIYE